jgi:hypothetical protein
VVGARIAGPCRPWRPWPSAPIWGCRDNASARSHHAGRHIHQHLDDLRVEVLITGADNEAREIALQLKTPMIRRHQPAWTVLNAPYMRKG